MDDDRGTPRGNDGRPWPDWMPPVNEFLAFTRDAARALGRRRGLSARDIDELATQTAARVWRLPPADRDRLRSDWKGWVWTKAESEVLDHVRSALHRHRATGGSADERDDAVRERVSPDPEPSATAELAELHAAVWKCVRALRDRLRERFLACSELGDGLTQPAAAARFGISADSLRESLALARESLAACLRSSGFGPDAAF